MDWWLIKVRLIASIYPQMLEALGVTVTIAALALPLAVVLGAVIALVRMYAAKPVRVVIAGWIEIMRNTPLLLQMFLLYFALPMLGWRLDGLYCGVLAIALQHSAFLAETFRGAIETISRRQW
jgi:His/Glu/Gln/Arg/opine family amino acid ABC transporter permease subunit